MSDEQANLQEAFLATLASLGGGAQHPTMIGALGWDEEQYKTVRDTLLAAKSIKPRRGRYGGVALPDYTAAVSKAKPKKIAPPAPEESTDDPVTDEG